MSEIKGYRELTSGEIAAINEIKDAGELLDQIINKIMISPVTDKRWAHIGQTDLQRGLMALTRAVAKPTNF